jgi:hypothetical protein
MWYSNLEETFLSRHVLHQHWYTCPISWPMYRNPQTHKSFDCCLRHFRISITFAIKVVFSPPETGNISSWISFTLTPFSHKKRTTERCSLVEYPQARSPFWLLKPASEHAHACLLPRLSCSWTVLLPSDTNVLYNCFTSICDLFTDCSS